MTYEEMQAEQAALERVLRDAGMQDVESLPFEPGESPAVAYVSRDGHELAAELVVL